MGTVERSIGWRLALAATTAMIVACSLVIPFDDYRQPAPDGPTPSPQDASDAAGDGDGDGSKPLLSYGKEGDPGGDPEQRGGLFGYFAAACDPASGRMPIGTDTCNADGVSLVEYALPSNDAAPGPSCTASFEQKTVDCLQHCKERRGTTGTCPAGSGACLCRKFVRGDANGDGVVTSDDADFILAHLFGGGPKPRCLDAADANDDGLFDQADAITINDMLSADGGAPLPAPFPMAGFDPTSDTLRCGY